VKTNIAEPCPRIRVGKDVIKIAGDSFYAQFGRTGNTCDLNMWQLDRPVRFRRIGTSIHVVFGDTLCGRLLESFPSESLAAAAFMRLRSKLHWHMRWRAITAIWKGIVRWVALPVLLAMLALALNMATTRGMGAAAMAGPPGSAPLVPVPASVGVPAARPLPAVSPAELAKAMADGVKSGKYSVKLSGGSKGTLYVFSDPSCPHCRELEPELDTLARDYTIFVFPVTVIGGEQSTHRTAKLLCTKPSERATMWKKIVNGGDIQGTECADGAASVAANDQFFRVMRFIGTPTIISAAGEQLPDTLANTAPAIDAWMRQAGGAQK
jgi:TrbB protein